MKTLSIVLMAVMLIAGFGSALTFAQENTSVVDTTTETPVTTSAPVDTATPVSDDSDLDLNESVSNGKVFWKQLDLWFTFKEDKRVQKQLNLARLRLIQAKVAAKNGNEDAVQKALEAHERIMNRTREEFQKMKFEEDSMNKTSPVSQLITLENAIQVHERRIASLNETLLNGNLTEAQRERIQEKIEHANEVTDKLQNLSINHEEKIVTKYMARNNLSQEEAEDQLELKKQEREERREENKQRIETQREALKQERERARESVDDSNDSEEQED